MAREISPAVSSVSSLDWFEAIDFVHRTERTRGRSSIYFYKSVNFRCFCFCEHSRKDQKRSFAKPIGFRLQRIRKNIFFQSERTVTFVVITPFDLLYNCLSILFLYSSIVSFLDSMIVSEVVVVCIWKEANPNNGIKNNVNRIIDLIQQK